VQRARGILLLAILALPMAAGCLGGEKEEGPRLAQPTTSPPAPPKSPSPLRPTTSYNFSDPGVRMTGPWRAGDGWDYESDQGHYRRVRVVDSRLVSGTQLYVVREETGDVGQPAKRVVTTWIDGKQWLQLNATDDTGGIDRYTPGIAVRHLKNGSFAYNHTRVEGSGRASVDESVSVQTRLAAMHTTILFPWGYVEAKKIDVNATMRDKEGARTFAATTRWVHADYLNDVQYTTPSGETYKLAAARAGDFRRGVLSTG
jgi:hypothetical protein